MQPYPPSRLQNPWTVSVSYYRRKKQQADLAATSSEENTGKLYWSSFILSTVLTVSELFYFHLIKSYLLEILFTFHTFHCIKHFSLQVASCINLCIKKYAVVKHLNEIILCISLKMKRRYCSNYNFFFLFVTNLQPLPFCYTMKVTFIEKLLF